MDENVFVIINVIYPHLAHDPHVIPFEIKTSSPLSHGGDVNVEDNQKLPPDRG